MRNIKDFQARYDRWKNGERYWDIRGIDLPQYDTGDKTTMKKKDDFYTWLDQISDKKAQDWTRAPMKPLSTDEVYADMLNDPTYNYKTFYDLQPYMAKRMLTVDPNAHFTDIGKTMYHPTFSNESAYSGWVSDYNPLGITGGSWNEGGTEYTPSMSQLANYWNYNRTRDYLDHAEDHLVKINLPEYYTGKGGPSRSIRKYIASAEGSHFAGQNRRWGGDAVGTFYKRLGNIIGNDTWNALTQNQRDALTSYYYNIKPSSFNPTLNAIRQWATNGMKHDDLSTIRDTINVGMNNKKLSGLRKRRLYEQDLFMKDIQPTGIINGNIVQQVPSNNIQIPMNPEFNINTITVPIQPDIRSILNPRINIPLKPELYPDQKPDGSFYHGKSGIYINPANRGKFNATKKRTGKTTEELSHSKNPLTRKRAQFALNARKWKHQYTE